MDVLHIFGVLYCPSLNWRHHYGSYGNILTVTVGRVHVSVGRVHVVQFFSEQRHHVLRLIRVSSYVFSFVEFRGHFLFIPQRSLSFLALDPSPNGFVRIHV